MTCCLWLLAGSVEFCRFGALTANFFFLGVLVVKSYFCKTFFASSLPSAFCLLLELDFQAASVTAWQHLRPLPTSPSLLVLGSLTGLLFLRTY